MKNLTHKIRKSHCKKVIFISFLSVLIICLMDCLSLRLTPRDTTLTEGNCMVYYIVNTDGMKGLGHSILLLTDESGNGTVLSFNGMQRSLGESLLGQSGIGKMSVGSMNSEEVSLFLRTGNLDLDMDQLQDNYDWALYRYITPEAYDAILEGAQPYVKAGEQFELLYMQWAQAIDLTEKKALAEKLEQMGQDKTLPLYNIYTNNCDHTARSLASAADSSLQNYNLHTWHLTPNGNLKAFCRSAPQWGVMELGKNSLWERFLEFWMVF